MCALLPFKDFAQQEGHVCGDGCDVAQRWSTNRVFASILVLLCRLCCIFLVSKGASRKLHPLHVPRKVHQAFLTKNLCCFRALCHVVCFTNAFFFKGAQEKCIAKRKGRRVKYGKIKSKLFPPVFRKRRNLKFPQMPASYPGKQILVETKGSFLLKFSSQWSGEPNRDMKRKWDAEGMCQCVNQTRLDRLISVK